MNTTENNPITDAELAELRRMHAAANGHKLRVAHGTGRIETDSSPSGYVGMCVWGSDAESFAALHNAFPSVIARLEAAERDREEAKREWESVVAENSTLIAHMPEAIDCRRSFPATTAWLAARDAQQRREGAAEWLEIYVSEVKADRPHGLTVAIAALEQAAKRLREGGE